MPNNEQVVLIKQTSKPDEIGNDVASETMTTVLGDEMSTARAEFYRAAVSGLSPEKVFKIRKYEYDGEKIIEHEGIRYRVIRTFANGMENIELTCEKVIADQKG